LANKLRKRRYDAKPLHGGLTQPQRDRVVNSFRKGKLEFLVATDVAARGLDIQGITHIINYDIPLEALVYFHRIGRTARVGLEGTAITLVGYGQMSELNRIKALTKTKIEELEGHRKSYRESPKRHKTVCTNCGKKCEVPFKPDPNRPVYCKTCWATQKPPIIRPA
jgi:CxxC-x17-CxxC domain-containing protein